MVLLTVIVAVLGTGGRKRAVVPVRREACVLCSSRTHLAEDELVLVFLPEYRAYPLCISPKRYDPRGNALNRAGTARLLYGSAATGEFSGQVDNDTHSFSGGITLYGRKQGTEQANVCAVCMGQIGRGGQEGAVFYDVSTHAALPVAAGVAARIGHYLISMGHDDGAGRIACSVMYGE